MPEITGKENYIRKSGQERFCLAGALQLKDLRKPAGQKAWGQFGAQRQSGSEKALQANVLSNYKEESLGNFSKGVMVCHSHFSKSLSYKRWHQEDSKGKQRLFLETGRQITKPETLEMRNTTGFPFLEQRPQVKVRPKDKLPLPGLAHRVSSPL